MCYHEKVYKKVYKLFFLYTPTPKRKHEGLYYRKNKRNKKVFYARFKIDKKAYLRKLGEEPQMNTNMAYVARAELIGSMRGGPVTDGRDVDSFFEEYVESRRASLSDSWWYNINKNYLVTTNTK